MLVRLHRPHPGNLVGLTSAAVTPREVAELVREGLRAGWQPARPGRQFILEPRAAARGPQTWPRGQVSRSREQLLALARGRESCDRLRLADSPAHVSWPGGGGFQPCAIVINDRDLIEWVREVERPHAAREIAERRRDDPELDLDVDGLAGDYLHLTRRPLLGSPGFDLRHALAKCKQHAPARIEITIDLSSWSADRHSAPAVLVHGAFSRLWLKAWRAGHRRSA